jgi:hypothetical protein
VNGELSGVTPSCACEAENMEGGEADKDKEAEAEHRNTVEEGEEEERPGDTAAGAEEKAALSRPPNGERALVAPSVVGERAGEGAPKRDLPEAD